ncbi:MAG: hypothetical protein IJ608_08050 [Lachnospiraceae bacterium]|nr:hypothetical protein [Lachnospiraceae bacterium]
MMDTYLASIYDSLSPTNRASVDDFIVFLSNRQNNNEETIKTIQDAMNGIGLSDAYESVDDLMAALNA